MIQLGKAVKGFDPMFTTLKADALPLGHHGSAVVHASHLSASSDTMLLEWNSCIHTFTVGIKVIYAHVQKQTCKRMFSEITGSFCHAFGKNLSTMHGNLLKGSCQVNES